MEPLRPCGEAVLPVGPGWTGEAVQTAGLAPVLHAKGSTVDQHLPGGGLSLANGVFINLASLTAETGLWGGPTTQHNPVRVSPGTLTRLARRGVTLLRKVKRV